MKYRWTKKELKTISDKDLMLSLINERKYTLNCYAYLYQRLTQLKKTIENLFEKA